MRRLHVAICVAGLGLYVPGFVEHAKLAALPPELPVRELAYPVRLGGLEAAGPEELRFLGEGWAVGTRLELREADGGARSVELVRRRSHSYLALVAFASLFFWAMCLFAFTPRLALPGALGSFWTTFLYGLAIAIGGTYFRGGRPWLWSVPGYVHLTCLAALPVVFVWLTSSFPARHPVRDRLRWLLPGLAAVAAGLGAWQLWSFEAFFREPGPARAGQIAASGRVADLVMVGDAVLGVILLFQQGRAAERARERDQVRWLLRGFLVGAGPYVFLRTVPLAVGLPAPLPAAADRLFELAIPTTFLLVVARHQFLDIDVILRRGLIYGSVAAMLVVGWIFVLLAVRPIPVGLPAWASALLWVLFGVGAGLAFRPLRESVAEWADRNVFEIRHSPGEHRAALENALRPAASADEVLGIVFDRLTRTLRPRRLAIVVRSGDEVLGEGRAAGPEPEALLGEWTRSGCGDRRIVARPGSTDQPDAESERFPPALRETFAMGATMRRGVEPRGVILVGSRRSGRHWVGGDLSLLRDVAETASTHLERVELARLDALHRAKSEFLSRVAHDLRTPLTSISWSAQNLLDGVVGELSPPQREYLGEIGHAGAYLNRLVQNLLRLSRLERGELEAHCARIDVAEVVRRSLRTVGPVARGRDVLLAPGFPAGPATAWADPDLLEEALVNLLENAVEFSPPGGSVDVTLENGEDGTRIRVRDRGPGLPPGAADALFERFTQGPRSPWSSRGGFGLGLYIARVHLDLMAGSLGAADHPEGGAVFTCELRAEASGEGGGS
jgi:signal transduction histidine kinase